MQALVGFRCLRCAMGLIGRGMQSGSQMTKRRKLPNSAPLVEAQAVEWALSLGEEATQASLRV